MELDALKDRINSRLEDPVGNLSPEMAIRSTRSRSYLRKLGRNLRIEMVLYVVCLAFVVWKMVLTAHPAYRIYLATLVPFILAIMWKMRQVIRRIGVHTRAGASIREHLSCLLEILEANCRKYLYLSVGAVPFFTLYAFLLFHYFPGPEAPPPAVPAGEATSSPPEWVFVAVVVILTALVTGVIYLLSRLYIWWMFDRHIRRLREDLSDFVQDAAE